MRLDPTHVVHNSGTPGSTQKDEELLTAEEVGEGMLKASKSYAYQLSRSGAIDSVRIPMAGRGGRTRYLVRFRRADVVAFINRHYTGSKEGGV
jgi:hypothetical protein